MSYKNIISKISLVLIFMVFVAGLSFSAVYNRDTGITAPEINITSIGFYNKLRVNADDTATSSVKFYVKSDEGYTSLVLQSIQNALQKMVFVQRSPSDGYALLTIFNNQTTNKFIELKNPTTATTEFRVNGNGDTYIDGNLDVAGTLTKAAGSFKISNPESPDTEYLFHQFQESPEALLFYRGTNKDYNNGRGWYYNVTKLNTTNYYEYKITLPSWFNDLTFEDNNYNEFTGFLSGLNGFCGDYYFNFTEINKSSFRVVTEKECDFSWQIEGVRHDDYYDNNPMFVVVKKEIQPTGLYITE